MKNFLNLMRKPGKKPIIYYFVGDEKLLKLNGKENLIKRY